MRPLPETEEALRELAVGGDLAVSIELFTIARRVRQVVPDLVGLSLALLDDDQVTLTVVATAEEVAALDAVQYLDDGPCEAAVADAHRVEAVVEDLLDEGQWLMYANASAATGIASSLTLPIMQDGHVIGSVNMYGATPQAFHGRHDQIAQAVGASAEHAIVNADLSFQTAKEAMRAPERLRENKDINVALGIIAAGQALSLHEAQARLREAAARAGITEAQAARAIRSTRA